MANQTYRLGLGFDLPMTIYANQNDGFDLPTNKLIYANQYDVDWHPLNIEGRILNWIFVKVLVLKYFIEMRIKQVLNYIRTLFLFQHSADLA